MKRNYIYSNSVDELMDALEADGAFDDDESTEETIEEVEEKSSTVSPKKTSAKSND